MSNQPIKEKRIIDKNCKKCHGVGYVNITSPTGENMVVKCDCNKTESEQIALNAKEDSDKAIAKLQIQINELSSTITNLLKALEISKDALPAMVAKIESGKTAKA